MSVERNADGTFKKGSSGNKSGRPKGTRNLITDVLEEMAEKQIVEEGGRRKRLSNQRIMVKAQRIKAQKGDNRAFDSLARILMQKLASELAEKPEEVFSDVDETLIDDFLKHWSKRKRPDDPAPEEDPWAFLE